MTGSIRGRVTILTLLGLLALASASSQGQDDTAMADDIDLAQLCRQEACRQDARVQIRLPDGTTLMEELGLYRPPVLDGSVSILLGETVSAVPEFRRNQFENWREPARQERRRNPLLTISLQQDDDGSIAATIENDSDAPVKLRLFTRLVGSTEESYTSSCPVIAGGSVFEYWSEPVAELIIHDANLVSGSAALLCD